MLLLSLLFVAVLMGIFSFTAVINAQLGQPRKPVQPSLPHQQVSLWSLVLFLFFPWGNTQNKAPL